MKKYFLLAVIAIVAYGTIQYRHSSLPGLSSRAQSNDGILQRAYNNRLSDLQVRGEGVVIKILPDDNKGSRHQRFIVRLSGGPTLLIAHNIDLAPRINGLSGGDKVAFYGEYEWNEKGGVLHWTHHDPSGRHIDGWLKHDGEIYQ